jgi:hypothetical protein
MSDWYCFKDKVKMVEADVNLKYMFLTQEMPGLKCPKCGVEYLTEQIVMTALQDAEATIEGK